MPDVSLCFNNGICRTDLNAGSALDAVILSYRTAVQPLIDCRHRAFHDADAAVPALISDKVHGSLQGAL